MKIVTKEIEPWIKPFSTINDGDLKIDRKLRNENPSKYFLHLTIPNEFDSYAILLHSFWINKNIPQEKICLSENDTKEYSEKEFDRINWKKFYENKGEKFDLNNAILNSVDWNIPFKQFNNELYPGEGLLDEEHINSIIEIVKELYGNQEIETFHTFLNTENWEKDRIHKGKITELKKLLTDKELNKTPNLIYSKDKKWVVNTDYDLAFTFIGGEKRLIQELVKWNEDEIFEIKY